MDAMRTHDLRFVLSVAWLPVLMYAVYWFATVVRPPQVGDLFAACLHALPIRPHVGATAATGGPNEAPAPISPKA